MTTASLPRERADSEISGSAIDTETRPDESVWGASRLDSLRGIPARIMGASIWAWLTAAILILCMVLVFVTMGGTLLFRNTTATGGDMGAHVWGPAYLRDSLLPDFRITGWAPDWYAGFAAYRFYMVLPAIAVVLLDVFMPYNVAFKLVAVSGVVLMPLASYGMGRLAGFRRPIPLLLGAFTLPFLYDTNFHIYGGNMASTLAGEFSFSISLAIGILYIGALIRGLTDGTHRTLAAVLLALTGLCHLIPAIFLVGVTAIALFVKALPEKPLFARVGLLSIFTIGGLYWARSIAVDWPLNQQIIAGLVVGWMYLLVVGASLFRPSGRGRFWWIASHGVVGAMLSAFWVLPFWWDSGFVNDMGWEKIQGGGPGFQFLNNLLQPHETDTVGDAKVLIVFFALALIGFIACVITDNRAGLIIGLSGVAAAVAFVVIPQYRLWNARLLPFWYLAVYFMAAIGVGYLLFALRRVIHLGSVGQRALAGVSAGAPPPSATDSDDDQHDETDHDQTDHDQTADETRFFDGDDAPTDDSTFAPSRFVDMLPMVGGVLVGLALLIHAAGPVGKLPFGSNTPDALGWPIIRTNDDSFLDNWAEWNFKGLEGRGAAYTEFHGIVSEMDRIGDANGCGRALWEYDRDTVGSYGTPMALMLLPHFTGGCIGSMEGLYFEASMTVPFHFIMQDELSANPSRPMRDVPYPNRVDVAQGVEHLQMFGVRYYIAFSDDTKQQADLVPELTLIGESAPWTVYEVADAPLVSPLDFEPVVADGFEHGGREFIDPAVEWFNDPAAWDVTLAVDGPDEWARIDLGDEPPRSALPPVTVSDIVEGDHRLSFTVDQVGVPVVVKTSYFPNWTADGADGPYRITPNLMAVIPTDTQVTMNYGREPSENLGWLLSLIGLGLAVVMARRRLIVAGDGPSSDGSEEVADALAPYEGLAPIRPGLDVDGAGEGHADHVARTDGTHAATETLAEAPVTAEPHGSLPSTETAESQSSEMVEGAEFEPPDSGGSRA